MKLSTVKNWAWNVNHVARRKESRDKYRTCPEVERTEANTRSLRASASRVSSELDMPAPCVGAPCPSLYIGGDPKNKKKRVYKGRSTAP